MDNGGHYFCLQSFALTHRLSLFILTDLSEGSKPVLFPLLSLLWSLTIQVFSRPQMPLGPWHWGGFPDCAFNCILNRVDKHTIIYRKEDWPCCQNTHILPFKFIPWILASWEQDSCKFRVTPHSQDRVRWRFCKQLLQFAHCALKLSPSKPYLQAEQAKRLFTRLYLAC